MIDALFSDARLDAWWTTAGSLTSEHFRKLLWISGFTPDTTTHLLVPGHTFRSWFLDLHQFGKLDWHPHSCQSKALEKTSMPSRVLSCSDAKPGFELSNSFDQTVDLSYISLLFVCKCHARTSWSMLVIEWERKHWSRKNVPHIHYLDHLPIRDGRWSNLRFYLLQDGHNYVERCRVSYNHIILCCLSLAPTGQTWAVLAARFVLIKTHRSGVLPAVAFLQAAMSRLHFLLRVLYTCI